MKRFYKFFLSMLLCMTGVAAYADDIKVTINVDDASRIGIEVNYTDQEVSTGSNVFTIPQYTRIKVYAKSGALIKNIKNETNGYDAMSRIGTECSEYPYADVTYTVTSVNEDEVYTKSFKVNIDNPAGVETMLSPSYRSVALNQGENIVKYDPTTETTYAIRKGYGKPIYKVTKDGAEVTAGGMAFEMDITEGMAVDITSEWPADVKYNLTFKWGSEETKGFLKSVQVDGIDTPVADVMEIAGGSQVSVTGNNTEYILDAFSVDGVSQSFYGQYNFYITKNTVIDVTAHKAKMITCTLNIDDPANVTVYKGYQYENNVISLVSGNNIIEFSENGNKKITIVANNQCFISSINDGTTDLTVSASGTTLDVTDGMVYTVKTGKIVRDKEAKVTVYGRELANYYFNFYSNNDRNVQYDFAEESNALYFGDFDLPFNFGCAGSSNINSSIYIDGIRAHQYYGQYQLFFADGASIVIDLNGTLKDDEKTVSVTLGDGIEKTAIEKMETAIGQAYEWETKGFSSLTGTLYTVTITPAAEANIEVLVDNKKAEKNAEGKFIANITSESKTISIVSPTATAISNVGNANAANGKIYTVQGVEVKNATKGLYIINGKKYLVK